MVGSFSGGPADLQRGPIFFYMVHPYIRYKSRGASTLAGGPGPRALPPDTTGLSLLPTKLLKLMK